MSIYRQFFSESLALLSARGLMLAVRIGTSILVARALGPELYGEFAYALSVIFILTVLCGLGMMRPVLRLSVERRSADDVLFPTALILALSATALAVSGIWLVEGLSQAGLGLLALMAPMLITATSDLVVNWHQGQQSYRPIALLQGSVSLLTAVLVIGLYFAGATAAQFAMVMVFDAALSAAVVWWNRPRELRIRASALRRDFAPNVRRILGEAWPFLVNDMIFLAMVRVDQIAVSHLAGSEEMAFYVVAGRLTELSAFAPNVVATAFIPVLAQLRTRGDEFTEHVLRQVYIAVLAAGLLCSAVLVLARTPLIQLIFGSSYLPSTDIIAIHAWACAPAFLIALRAQWVTLHGYQHRFLLFGFVGAIAQIATLWLLVPHYGGRGAAVAYLVGLCTYLYVAPLFGGAAIARHTRVLLGTFNVLRWPAAMRTVARVVRGGAGSLFSASPPTGPSSPSA